MKLEKRSILSLLISVSLSISLLVPLVSVRAQTPQVHIDKVAASAFANPGTSIEYTITITNDSAQLLQGLRVRESWPDPFRINGQPSNFVTWAVDSLNTHESVSKVVTVAIPYTVKAGNYFATTEVFSNDGQLLANRQDPLEIRTVNVLGTELPQTDGPHLLLVTLGLVLNFSLISSYFLTKAWNS